MASAAWIVWPIVGYLSGSVPFALLIGFAHGVDIRAHGSGNVGASNCGRVVGRKWGLLCFALDVLKGLVPVLAAGLALHYVNAAALDAMDSLHWLSVGVAAVLGHVFPVWLGFRGGKGVATGLGVLLGFWPTLTVPALVAVAAWIIVLAAGRIISLASILATLSLPLTLIALALLQERGLEDVWPFLAVCGALVVLVLVRHRSNMARLWAGTEPRIGDPQERAPLS